MKKLILLVSLSFLVSGCHTFQTPRTDVIKVDFRGTPGLKFYGIYSVDGKEQHIVGTVPMSIETADGKFLSVFRTEGPGVLTVILNKDGMLYGEATSQTQYGGVQSKITPGELFDLTSTTGF